MPYIGSIPSYQTTAIRTRDDFSGDGTQICFALSQQVAGSFESNVTVVLNNVLQQPVEAYTIIDTTTLTLTSITGVFALNETVTGGTSSAEGTVIEVGSTHIVVRLTSANTFSTSESVTSSSASATTSTVDLNTGRGLLFSTAPINSSVIYVVYEGNATYDNVPSAGSVGPTQLTENLRNFTVDTFTGNGTSDTFSLSVEPATANALMVTVNGLHKTPTTDYSISGTDLIFTSPPSNSTAITVMHLGFSTVSRVTVPDASITTEKFAGNEDWGQIDGVVGSSLDFGGIA